MDIGERLFSLREKMGSFSSGGHRQSGSVEDQSEAIQFAVEILAPHHKFARYLRTAPDLDDVRALSKTSDLSKEAAARSYVELHRARIAMIFLNGGTVRYFD